MHSIKLITKKGEKVEPKIISFGSNVNSAAMEKLVIYSPIVILSEGG